ncbi:MAG TPA: methylated-DNA--[protein]-cysteine S-methyltransferase [Actinomycetota bacterium]|nr:methylated-DNA--[protein]-cysteine S-methyltransferase [Actinomycetota bacterium]
MTEDLFRGLRTTNVEGASRAAAERLATSARRRGLLDVAVGAVDSPLGRVTVFVTKTGLVRVAYPDERLDHVFEEIADVVSPRVLEDRKGTERARRQLDAYFEGRRRDFTVPIDWAFVPQGFFRRVLEATARIPFGSVSTYGGVARQAGSPRAARAAGNALHENPVPIVVPCHRVVPASGGIGRYGGDEWRKAWLLRLEGAISA